MIDQIYTYFTIEIIFLWLNLGVLPFWLILVFFPQSQICGVFITSIFPFIILSFAYGYLTYVLFNEGYDFIRNFELYLGLDSISNLFNDKSFLILFWTHFLSINLFCGCWIVKDSQEFGINKIIKGKTDVIKTLHICDRGKNINISQKGNTPRFNQRKIISIVKYV